ELVGGRGVELAQVQLSRHATAGDGARGAAPSDRAADRDAKRAIDVPPSRRRGSNEAAHRPKWAEREPGGRAAAEAAGARADAGRKRGAERVGRSEGRGAAKESVARISGSGCGR